MFNFVAICSVARWDSWTVRRNRSKNLDDDALSSALGFPKGA